MTDISNGYNTLSYLSKTGEDYYFDVLRSKLEQTDWGKYVVIEAESGDYFIDQDLMEALSAAEEKHPEKFFTIIKIGDLQPPATNFKKNLPSIRHAWPI